MSSGFCLLGIFLWIHNMPSNLYSFCMFFMHIFLYHASHMQWFYFSAFFFKGKKIFLKEKTTFPWKLFIFLSNKYQVAHLLPCRLTRKCFVFYHLLVTECSLHVSAKWKFMIYCFSYILGFQLKNIITRNLAYNNLIISNDNLVATLKINTILCKNKVYNDTEAQTFSSKL